MTYSLNHCVLQWKIHNIFMWDAETPLSSPLFEVCGKSVYQWRLELRPQTQGRQKTLSIRLRMYNSTSDTLNVNLKLSAVTHSKDFWLLVVDRHLFKNESVWDSAAAPVLEEGLCNLQEDVCLEKEIWIIECELTYVEESRYKRIQNTSPEWQAMEELSADLLKCFWEGDYKDIHLNTHSRTFEAHRAVLYVRHPSLRSNLGDPKWLGKMETEDQQQLGTTSLDSKEVDGEILQAVLKFAYTGDIETIKTDKPPPIELYKYTEEQRLDGLKGNIEFCCSTGQTVLKCSDTHLFFRKEKTCILTMDESAFQLDRRHGSEHFGWQLRGKWITQNSDPNCQTLSMYLRPTHTNLVLKVKLRLSIINTDGVCLFTRNVLGRVWEDNPMEVDKVIDESISRNPLIIAMPDVVEVYCHVTYYHGEYETSLNYPNTVIRASQMKSNLIRLRYNMRELFEEGFFADAFLETNEATYPVHRFLLSARSTYFASQFHQKWSQNENACPIIKVEKMSKETLKFIYCCQVKFEHNLLIMLHGESESFGIPSLKKICREFLKSELNLLTVCDILGTAERAHDPDLKRAAIEYHISTKCSLSSLPGFDALQREFPAYGSNIQ